MRFAFTAIESFANQSIDLLPETAALILTRRDKSEREVTKAGMVRGLAIVESSTRPSRC